MKYSNNSSNQLSWSVSNAVKWMKAKWLWFDWSAFNTRNLYLANWAFFVFVYGISPYWEHQSVNEMVFRCQSINSNDCFLCFPWFYGKSIFTSCFVLFANLWSYGSLSNWQTNYLEDFLRNCYTHFYISQFKIRI